MPCDRRNIDNVAISLLLHDRYYIFTAQKLTGEIGCHDAIPILKGNIFNLGKLIDGGIVDQDINAPISLKNCSDRLFNLNLVSDITGQR